MFSSPGCVTPLVTQGKDALEAPCDQGLSVGALLAGRFEPEVIEERRKAAEVMLRFTVPIPALNNSPQLKDFFQVSGLGEPRTGWRWVGGGAGSHWWTSVSGPTWSCCPAGFPAWGPGGGRRLFDPPRPLPLLCLAGRGGEETPGELRPAGSASPTDPGAAGRSGVRGGRAGVGRRVWGRGVPERGVRPRAPHEGRR